MVIDFLQAAAPVLAGMFFVWKRTDSVGATLRVGTVLASGVLGYTLGDDVALLAGTPRDLTMVAVTVFGPVFLEVGSAIAQNPERLMRLFNEFRKGGK